MLEMFFKKFQILTKGKFTCGDPCRREALKEKTICPQKLFVILCVDLTFDSVGLMQKCCTFLQHHKLQSGCSEQFATTGHKPTGVDAVMRIQLMFEAELLGTVFALVWFLSPVVPSGLCFMSHSVSSTELTTSTAFTCRRQKNKMAVD